MPQAKATRRFEDYLTLRDQFNVICPTETVLEISPLHKLVPEIVVIDSDPAHGEVVRIGVQFERGTENQPVFFLSKHGLEKLAQAAGIVFDPRNTRRTDDGKNPRRVEFQATGAMQKPDGSWITVSHSKEIDLDAIEWETRSSLISAALDEAVKITRSGKEHVLQHGTSECTKEIDRRVAKTMLFWQKNKVAVADTGAHNRVVRSLLLLKPFYSRDELAKPFVVPHVALNTKYILKDPESRRRFIQSAFTLSYGIFGPPRSAYETSNRQELKLASCDHNIQKPGESGQGSQTKKRKGNRP